MRLLFVVTLMLFASFSQASTIKLNYSVFFSYMKTMYKLDYPYVTTAFYLVDSDNQRLCHINNAEIVVEEVNEPILFQPEGRLLPFYSDQHRQDGAVLVVDLDDGKTLSSCNLQITVMAKERELANLNEQKLDAIAEQLEGVLKKNAGMIGKYFLPEFAGVRLTPTSTLTESQLKALGDQVSMASNGDLLLKKDAFNIINKINELNLLLKRITPWMVNNNPN
ncbi:DUF2987 domain-containing protein [uncultured Psychromonas sp.]|uniref:DUF2987 domain-containing protein n=1 Tax=uncultured Psychromonas sp. TaxID=173974 RepID=UPI002615CF93|nr:DUF2987 domain-containing protein [uncultured Psychromonas sp.]